jgi:protein dithiol oxidoreductase (disulfide-forming)
MRHRSIALILGFALMAAGCHKQGGTDKGPNLNSPAATATTQGAANPGKAAGGADKSGKATRLNQDGSETVEDSGGDSGAHNPLLAAVASTITGSSSAGAVALGGPSIWQPGVNYQQLVPAQPTDVAAGQAEVLEFFWYACPHCAALDPAVEEWRKKQPAWVVFRRVPVLWNDNHRAMARMFYTLEALGKIDALHGAIFKEIHTDNNPLVGADPANSIENERVQAAFVKKMGVSEDAFRNAYNSMGVSTAMQRADVLVQRYRVSGVPTFVVNGKYIADVASAGSPEKLIALVDDLVSSEHKR